MIKPSAIFYWIHHEAPPWLNLILTAGTHTFITFCFALIGWADRAAFAYIFKEGGPLVPVAFAPGGWAGKLEKLKKTYTPSKAQAEHGWTMFWVAADSAADVLGPITIWWLMT